METTAYCGCGQCCGWERGSWRYLKLDFWNRYISSGKNHGLRYSGLTASGTYPREPNPGLFRRPWYIFFPWLWFPHDGTLAADTNYYPFGTRFHIPGYGFGSVEDRGSAIKGKKRLDLFFNSHSRALEWGRQELKIFKVD
ncbi:MAG: 3D domain-containing protein [Deltaproteobacteria bacterium]|nr:3D domain-containing protein [Deltaproteobacteria bacterium]